MMQSILFWGIPIPSDLEVDMPTELGDAGRWSDRHIAFKLGFMTPTPPHAHAAWEAWEKFIEEREKVLNDSGCQIVVGGDFRDWEELPRFAAISASVWEEDVNAGDEEGRSNLPTKQPEWEPLLRSFCEKLGIPWSQPLWRMTASIG